MNYSIALLSSTLAGRHCEEAIGRRGNPRIASHSLAMTVPVSNLKAWMTSFLLIICILLLSSCSESDTQKSEKKQSDKLSNVVDRKKDKSSVTAANHNAQAPEDGAKSSVAYVDMFKIQENDIVIGNRDAKVVMIEYSSPTCPHCSYFHKEVLPSLRKKYTDTGKIAYIFREFVANKQDLDASILGRCYKNATDPLKLFDVIYISQDNWAFNKNYREILGNMGQLAGISREKYAECLNDPVITMFLVNNARTISTIPGFVGTPAFFVGGKMHKGAYSFEGLSRSIEDALLTTNTAITKESEQSKDATKKTNNTK